ncbi:MAG: ABC transporter permease [Bacteroidota bacterium]
MLKNYIKVALRNLWKSKFFSLINVGGLALGMAMTIVIGLWMWSELNYNKSYEYYDQIARVMQNQTYNSGITTSITTPKQLAPVLREEYGSNFEQVVRSSFIFGNTLAKDDQIFSKKGGFMDASAPDMLALEMIHGTRNGLEDINSILLSASAAQSFFGNENPINQSIKLGNDDLLRVAGVYKDLPQNSSFGELEFIAPWKLYEKGLPNWVGWGNSWFQTYVQIAPQSTFAQVSDKIKNVKLNNSPEEKAYNPQLFLHPMSKWYLHSRFEEGINVGGRITYVWLFGIIGVFVLLLACINFMNLSTARSEKRAREVGIRKSVGSSRGQLIGQFFSESVVLAVFAFVFSILLVLLMLPFFNEVAGKEMRILWMNPIFWLLGVGFALLTGIVAGSYPALYLSSFKPVKVLKGTFKAGKQAAIPRKALVVLQFTVSVILIIGTVVVFSQIQYVKDRPIGYNQNGLINIPIKSKVINEKYDLIRNELRQNSIIDEMAISADAVTRAFTTNGGLDWEGRPDGMQNQFWSVRVSHDFGKTIGWEVVEGRDFSREFGTDSMAFVINEAAVKYMGIEDPVGKKMTWGDNGDYTIIGVVKNMVMQSPYTAHNQMFFVLDYNRSSNAIVKINPNANPQDALAALEATFKKYDPNNPFEYEFVDQDYAQKFGEEERVGKLAGFFALLAIFISCLGLFAMVSFVAEQRTREIGIRKVLGASIGGIVALLSKDFLLLVVLALFIASPLAYYFMNQWLEGFTYHIEIQWWFFVVAGVLSIGIAFLTVSFQSVKAAVANPIKALRNE